MAQNKKQSSKQEELHSLPIGLGSAVFLVAALLSLGSAITYTPADLPLTSLKLLKEFALSTEPLSPRQNIFGPLGAFLGFLQLQLFGLATFLIPIGLIFFTIYRLIEKKKETLMMRIGLLLAILFGSGVLGCHDEIFRELIDENMSTNAGGVFGQIIGESILEKLLATIGATFVLIVGYCLSVIILCSYHPLDFFGDLWGVVKRGVRQVVSTFSELSRARRSRKTSLSERLKRNQPATSALSPTESLPKTPESKSSEIPNKSEQDEQIPLSPLAAGATAPQIIDGTAQKRPSSIVPNEKPFTKKEANHSGLNTDGYEDYELPGYELLNFDTNDEPSDTNRDELIATQRVIIETLKSFGVEVTPGDITRGPTITRFEVYPALGLKVSRITALEADLARVTKAEAINILAPIPGKDTVGVEVANANRILVSFSEILLDEQFRNSKRKIPLALGKNVYGEAVIGDLAAMPHCLVAGATGAGKSVCINTIIASILYKFGPNELRFIMVDPKVVEMQMYSKLPHLVVPVVTDPKKVVGALKWCVNEMERRYKLFAKCGVRNFDGFNKRERPVQEEAETVIEPEIDEPVDDEHIESIANALEDGELGGEAEYDEDLEGFPDESDEEEMPDRLPYIVIIIDELADLMQTASADVELCIARIAQKARAAGIHLIVATQTPRADVVTGIIKANIPSRIAFQVSSKIDSRVILDAGGAEKLIGKGDMLFLPPGSAKLERSQGAFVSDDEVEKIVEFCSTQAEQKFEESVQQSIESGGDGGGADEEVNDADEELLEKCLEIVIQEGKASTSMLQRRLRLGYTRAARIVDLMEQRGYVGPADGARPREVYAGK